MVAWPIAAPAPPHLSAKSVTSGGLASRATRMKCFWRPASLEEFAGQSTAVQPIFDAVREMAEAAREALGEERLQWLRRSSARLLRRSCAPPLVRSAGSMTLAHATPGDLWRVPAADAPGATLDAVYRPLTTPVVVYAHIHRPYIRHLSGVAIANTGSAGLPYDGDPRASYLLLDDEVPAIRRVEYDIEKECGALRDADRPGAPGLRPCSAPRHSFRRLEPGRTYRRGTKTNASMAILAALRSRPFSR